MDILRSLAQAAAPATPGGTGTTTTTPTQQQLQPINIRNLPKFNSNLFSNQPDIINDLNSIVNVVNKYMITLSGNKLTYDIVWQSPSITGSEFSNSLKNLVNLGKWIYSSILTPARRPYTVAEMVQIFTNFVSTLRSYSFPDIGANKLQSDLVAMANIALSKLQA